MLSLEPNVVSRHTFVMYSYTVKWIQSIQIQALRRSMSIRGSPERLKTGNTPPIHPPCGVGNAGGGGGGGSSCGSSDMVMGVYSAPPPVVWVVVVVVAVLEVCIYMCI